MKTEFQQGRRVWIVRLHDPARPQHSPVFADPQGELLGVYTSSDRAVAAIHFWKRTRHASLAHYRASMQPIRLNEPDGEAEDILKAMQ